MGDSQTAYIALCKAETARSVAPGRDVQTVDQLVYPVQYPICLPPVVPFDGTVREQGQAGDLTGWDETGGI